MLNYHIEVEDVDENSAIGQVLGESVDASWY